MTTPETSDKLTPEEAKCIRVALVFGDPRHASPPQPDPRLENAKRKLRAIEVAA